MVGCALSHSCCGLCVQEQYSHGGCAWGDALAVIDFTTAEVWTKNGLVTVYLLFVMELATRRIHFAGSTSNPDQGWMKQVARNLTDAEDGFLNGKRYILMDRDAKFSAAYRAILGNAGVAPVRLPPQSPNLNALSLSKTPGWHLKAVWKERRTFGAGSLPTVSSHVY
jgi:hypothetical protein